MPLPRRFDFRRHCCHYDDAFRRFDLIYLLFAEIFTFHAYFRYDDISMNDDLRLSFRRVRFSP